MKYKKPKSKKKIVFKILLILVLILLVLFIFRHNIEATYKGVDVKYIENPRYCQVDSDCIYEEKSCSYVNIYNYEKASAFSCFGRMSVSCLNNTCEVVKNEK